MQPVTSLEKLFQWPGEVIRREHCLCGFFLYSTDQASVGKYVREHFDELYDMTGRRCVIFFVDKDRAFSKDQAHDYWRRCGLDERLWEGFWDTTPYDPGETYRVADALGIPKDSIPCLIISRGFDSRELSVFRLDPSWDDGTMTQHLQQTFALLQDVGEAMQRRDPETTWKRFAAKLTRADARAAAYRKYGEGALVVLGTTLGAILRGMTREFV